MSAGRSRTSSWGVGIVAKNVFLPGDYGGFALSSPKRIESGAVVINAPVGVTLEGRPVYGDVSLPMSASGQESRLEFAWRRKAGAWNVGASYANRYQPNHDAAAVPVDELALSARMLF